MLSRSTSPALVRPLRAVWGRTHPPLSCAAEPSVSAYALVLALRQAVLLSILDWCAYSPDRNSPLRGYSSAWYWNSEVRSNSAGLWAMLPDEDLLVPVLPGSRAHYPGSTHALYPRVEKGASYAYGLRRFLVSSSSSKITDGKA